MTTDELKVLVFRYFMSYWNNRRICSANVGLPPMVKRRQYYNSLKKQHRYKILVENVSTILYNINSKVSDLTAKTELKEGKTSPPKYFTDDTLLSSMENANKAETDAERKGIGTPATRR